ncbi:hypothetical protein J6590_102789, partial [Homalodisca vitripennis]
MSKDGPLWSVCAVYYLRISIQEADGASSKPASPSRSDLEKRSPLVCGFQHPLTIRKFHSLRNYHPHYQSTFYFYMTLSSGSTDSCKPARGKT